MPARPLIACVVALLLAPAPAFAAGDADTLYKCVDAAGLTTIQNSPCPKGQTQAWARATTPEPPPTPEQLAEQQARREQADREAAERAKRKAAEVERARANAAVEEELADEERAQADAAAEQAGVAAADAAVPEPAEEPPADGEAILDEQAAREKKCTDARQFAIDLRAKPWLDLDDAQWQRVYGAVVQACRGLPRH